MTLLHKSPHPFVQDARGSVLAEESSQSTELITEIIKLIQQDTEDTIKSTEERTRQEQTGLEVVDVSGDLFPKIENSIT